MSFLPPIPFDGSRSFDSCGLRATRAMEHHETLVGLLGEVDGQALACAWTGFDERKGYDLLEVTAVPRIDPYCGAVLGDLIHNLRAALDNLVWALVKLGEDPVPENPRHVSFPLYQSEKLFDSDPQGRMPGIRTGDRAILKRYQPYHGGETTKGHPFSLLNYLARIDKHRVVNPIALSSARHAFQVDLPSDRVKRMLEAGDPVYVGAEVLRVYGPNVHVKGHVACTVAFEDRQPIMPGLTAISLSVAELLTEFSEKYEAGAHGPMPPTK